MKYKILAVYKVHKELIVEVPSGDPQDPNDWSEIENEQDLDCYLYDVDFLEPYEDD